MATPDPTEAAPRFAPGALRAELAASIDHTLQQQARLNEGSIAAIRVATLAAICGTEIWLLSGPSALGAQAPIFASWSFAYLLVSLITWGALRRGAWSPALGFVLPFLDAGYTTARIAAVLSVAGIEHALYTQQLATVTAMASLLAISGAFRLDQRSALLTIGLGLAQYLGFAAWLGVDPFHRAIHVSLIGAIGGSASALARLVRRAVHSEVTRLTLRRLLPAPVIDAADADPMALLTEPRSVEATIVVTDLRGFTAWAESQTPLEVLGFLNAAQGALAAAVLDEGGTVDKFMGDGMLAVFGAPHPLPDHAARAVRAAAAMVAAAERFAPLSLGVGVHSGEVVVGCVGSGIRMEFTVLGDTVNTASRLEAATKDREVPVLISAATAERCGVALAGVGLLPIRGRAEGVEAFTLPGS